MHAALLETEILPGGIPIRVARAKPHVVVLPERDRRSMNHMDAETKAIHMRLESWGKWSVDVGLNPWPKHTLLARVIDQGPSGAAQHSRAPISMPDDIGETDAAVGHLGQIDQGVIKTYYCAWEAIEVMARRHSMRVRQFQNVLQRARWRIGGYLAALKRSK